MGAEAVYSMGAEMNGLQGALLFSALSSLQLNISNCSQSTPCNLSAETPLAVRLSNDSGKLQGVFCVMALVHISGGYTAIVDDQDAARVSRYHWNMSGKGYATTHVNRKYIFLHRFILNVTDPTIQVDHINGDRLDCRRSNLRHATSQQNAMNRRKSGGRSSAYKGVTRRGKYWEAQITANGKNVYLGRFTTEQGAALAYDKAAVEYFGEFALINTHGTA